VRVGLRVEIANPHLPRRQPACQTRGFAQPVINPNEDKLERWGIKAEKAARAFKIAMSPDVKVFIRNYEDDPQDVFKFSSALQHASMCTMPSGLSKNRSLSRWRALSTG
jgi:hypothetical protein